MDPVIAHYDPLFTKSDSTPTRLRLSNMESLKNSQHDTNNLGQTLLLQAIKSGSYQMTQLCLNTNINYKPSLYKTTIDICKSNKFYHIEQLLLFHQQQNELFSQKLQNTTNKINQQQGILINITNKLQTYDSITKTFFQDTMIDIMIHLIQNKLLFSDDLLNLCWEFELENKEKNILDSNLWQTIYMTSKEVIQGQNERDWHWLKTVMIPSTVWIDT